MKVMPRKREIFSLAAALNALDALTEARGPGGAVDVQVLQRYAHQTPGYAVALFQSDVCELAQLLIDGNLVLYPDAKAALVRCIDELKITKSSKKDI